MFDIPKPTLTQLDSLIRDFRNDENIVKHWNVEDMYSKLKEISGGQYKRFLALHFHKKYIEINKFLEQFKVERI